MREFLLDYAFRPRARAEYAQLHEIHRADVDRRVDFLCRQPEPDDEWTFAWEEEAPDRFIFYDDSWLIVYALIDEGRVVEIWSITPAGRV